MLAEEVIKPCVVDMADIILRDGAVRKLKQVALSNDTICRRINDLNIDIHNQLILDFKTSPLKTLLQLDESTDVSNFVCYVKEKKVEEEFFFVNHYQISIEIGWKPWKISYMLL